jgi:hypothetical protein
MTQPMTQTRFSGPNAQGVQPDPVVTYIPKAPGQLYVYEIPPIGADSLAALQNWFFSSVAGAIGPDRADIVVTKASQSNDFWLQSGEHVVLAIMDRSGTNDSDISGRSEWKVYTYNGNGGTGSMSGSGVDSVPPQWAYLFQDATDNATPAGK